MFYKIFSVILFYKKHVESLLDGFDSIIPSRTLPSNFPNGSGFNLKYLVPFMLSISIVLDCVILVIGNGFKLKPLPELYQRIVLSLWPNYWDQGDIIFLCAYFLAPTMYSALMFDRFLHKKNFFYHSQDETNSTLYDSQGYSKF